MTDDAPKPDGKDDSLAGTVGRKASRKAKARRDGAPGVWFGLGTMGLIGWSVAVPTLLGAAIGIWLDSRHSGDRSWTLALLMAGLAIGCFSAWGWVSRQDRDIHDQEGDDDA